MYEWFERVSGCWISTQWTFPCYQSTCVFPTSSNSWGNAEPFYRNAEPQRRTAKHLGHAWHIGDIILSTRNQSVDFQRVRTHITACDQWKPNTCKNCLNTEPNHPEYPLQEKVSLEEQKAQKDSFLRGRQIAYLIYKYFRVTGTYDFVEKYAAIYSCSSTWWGIRFGRSSIIEDANPVWWYLGKLALIENTRVWETQDLIGIAQYGDSSEESWIWLSPKEDNCKKTYRAEMKNFEVSGQNSVNKEV